MGKNYLIRHAHTKSMGWTISKRTQATQSGVHSPSGTHAPICIKYRCEGINSSNKTMIPSAAYLLYFVESSISAKKISKSPEKLLMVFGKGK